MKFGALDALDLLDWKRQVSALYEVVRASADPRQAWEHGRASRDRLFREHPQPPLPAAVRAEFFDAANRRAFEDDDRKLIEGVGGVVTLSLATVLMSAQRTNA